MCENEATGASVDKGDKPEEDWKKKAREREIGKCPVCGRIIRYQDVEGWEASPVYLRPECILYSISKHSGNCPNCNQSLTATHTSGKPGVMYDPIWPDLWQLEKTTVLSKVKDKAQSGIYLGILGLEAGTCWVRDKMKGFG